MAATWFGLFLLPPSTSAKGGETHKGKLIYEKNCIPCHGNSGKGDGIAGKFFSPPPADFTSQEFKEDSVGELLEVIHEGKGNMPSFEERLSEEEMVEVLGYIRSCLSIGVCSD